MRRGFQRRNRRAGEILAALFQILWPVLFYDLATVVMYHFTKNLLGRYGTICLAAAVCAAVFFLVRYRRIELYDTECGYARRRAGNIFIETLVIGAMAAVISAIINLLMNLTGLAGLSDSYNAFSEDIFSTALWLQVLTTVLLVPLVEELTFRGLAYERMRNFAGVHASVIASSLLFGIAHGNISQGIYAFLLGIPLAIAYEKKGLRGAVTFHAFCNLAAVLAVFFFSMPKG